MSSPDFDPDTHPDARERLNEATARRLARLRTMPVDTGRLEAALRARVPDPQPQLGPQQQARPRAGRRRLLPTWLKPMRAAAAAVVLLAFAAAALLSTTGGPAMASSAQMAKMHEDLVAGHIPSVQVDTIEEANRVLAAKSPQCPQIPDVPQEHVMACCLKNVKDKKVACVLLRSEGVPVTMVVANAGDMRSPESPTAERGGVTYHVQSSGPLQMVMAERHGRWVCIIGQVPQERLMDLASALEF